jgi:hypothetical protein
MFFGNPAAAFANLRRALRPGGRLAFVCFRDRQLDSWWTVPLAAAATIVPPEPPTPAHESGPFSLSDEARLRAILGGAGFVGTICEPMDPDVVIGSDLDSGTDFCINAGPAARMVAGASDEGPRARSSRHQRLHIAPSGFRRSVTPPPRLGSFTQEPEVDSIEAANRWTLFSITSVTSRQGNGRFHGYSYPPFPGFAWRTQIDSANDMPVIFLIVCVEFPLLCGVLCRHNLHTCAT